jgi:hypothetical protein
MLLCSIQEAYITCVFCVPVRGLCLVGARYVLLPAAAAARHICAQSPCAGLQMSAEIASMVLSTRTVACAMQAAVRGILPHA